MREAMLPVRFQQRKELGAEEDDDVGVLHARGPGRCGGFDRASATSPKNAPGPSSRRSSVRGRRQDDLDASAEDEEKALALLAGVEDDLVGEVLALVHEAVDHGEIAHGEVLEQDDILQHLHARITRG